MQTKMTNAAYWGLLFERLSHPSTMRPLNPLEQEWVEDYARHRESLTSEEREAFDNAEITVDW